MPNCKYWERLMDVVVADELVITMVCAKNNWKEQNPNADNNFVCTVA